MKDDTIVDIDAIKEILIDNNIEAQKTSKNWLKLRCLFDDHDDKTPSFFISPNGGYNCYGCHRSGALVDLFDALGWADEYDFPLIANNKNINARYNRALSFLNRSNTIKFDLPPSNLIVKDDNCKYYKYCLKRGIEQGINIFDIRKPSTVVAAQYGLSYCNRIIIPVHDKKNRIIWGEGRLITNKKKGIKYYRPRFAKKEYVLFNLNRINNYDFVYVCEGILDAITLYLAGYPAVATFGTSVLQSQIEMLAAFNTVLLCFDADAAGLSARHTVGNKLLMSGCDVKIIELPRGKDWNDVKIEGAAYYANRSINYTYYKNSNL